MTTKILAPLLSVNDPEAEVSEVRVAVADKISKGQIVCVLATTKSTFDVEAERDGYVHRLFIVPGDSVAPGTPLIEIGDEPPVPRPKSDGAAPAKAPPKTVPEGLRITQKALAIAAELGVDIDTLPRNALVTEEIVRAHAAAAHRGAKMAEEQDIRPAFTAYDVIVYGAGGHAKTIVDLLAAMRSLRPAGVVSDPPCQGSEWSGLPVLGSGDAFQSLYDRGLRLAVNAVASVNRPRLRAEISHRLMAAGFGFPALVHPRAVVEPSARLADGVQIFGAAFVGSFAEIRFGAIVNSGAIVSHDCVLGESAHMTPGAILAGAVRVGRGALIGMGAMINIGVNIGDWARIGNGAFVHTDVPAHAIIPAGSTWPAK